MEHKKTFNNSNQKFVRWQGRTIDERGKAINLFLGMSFATVGFVITQLTKSEFKFNNCFSRIFVVFGTLLLLVSIILLIWLTLNRMKGFRMTTKLAGKKYVNQPSEGDNLKDQNRQIDSLTYRLFGWSLWTFGISESFIVLGFIIQVWSKL